MSAEGLIMARGQGVLAPLIDPSFGPNQSFYLVPTNREKASFIVNWVAFVESTDPCECPFRL